MLLFFVFDSTTLRKRGLTSELNGGVHTSLLKNNRSIDKKVADVPKIPKAGGYQHNVECRCVVVNYPDHIHVCSIKITGSYHVQ